MNLHPKMHHFNLQTFTFTKTLTLKIMIDSKLHRCKNVKGFYKPFILYPFLQGAYFFTYILLFLFTLFTNNIIV